MIKQTFYNLPEHKRQRVINAVVEEFANAESDKVSINHIVQNADISRGSFYQYFDDKLDLVEVLIKSFIDKGIDDVRRAIVSWLTTTLYPTTSSSATRALTAL